jgi:hypothetical protein
MIFCLFAKYLQLQKMRMSTAFNHQVKENVIKLYLRLSNRFGKLNKEPFVLEINSEIGV